MCGTLILSYISRFCPFLEIHLNYIFCWGGGGAGDQKNKYVWRYDEIMIFFYVLGGHFYQFWAFKGQCSDFEKVFGIAKVRICFGYA